MTGCTFKVCGIWQAAVIDAALLDEKPPGDMRSELESHVPVYHAIKPHAPPPHPNRPSSHQQKAVKQEQEDKPKATNTKDKDHEKDILYKVDVCRMRSFFGHARLSPAGFVDYVLGDEPIESLSLC